MTDRIDEIDKYYKPIIFFSKIAKLFFAINVCISIVILFSDDNFKYPLTIAFIVFFLLRFILSQLVSLIYLPKAENKRHLQFLTNALNVPLTIDETSQYYNNNFSPSIYKIALNDFENSLFSKNIAEKMLFETRLITIVYFMTFIICITHRSTPLNYILIITQTLFSSEIIIYWFKLEWLKIQFDNTFKNYYTFFLHTKKSNDIKDVAEIIDYHTSYEAAKLSASIVLSSEIFNKLNPSLSDEWIKIKDKLNLN